MANYPFDQRFKDAVQRVSGPDDDGWLWSYLLSNDLPPGRFLEELAVLGYSAEAVRDHVDALNSMSTSDLIELAIADGCCSESPALCALQARETREAFDAARDSCSSTDPQRRDIGALMLMRSPGLTFREEAISTVRALTVAEKNPMVLASLACALLQLGVDDRSSLLERSCTSDDQHLRLSIAYSLGGLNDDVAIRSLILLSQDADDEVRSWATFGLGALCDVDTPDVRDSLCKRLSDSHRETRLEAIVGLARRHDRQALQPLIDELQGKDVWMMALEAAEEFQESSLYPFLIKLRRDEGGNEELERAIAACSGAENAENET